MTQHEPHQPAPPPQQSQQDAVFERKAILLFIVGPILAVALYIGYLVVDSKTPTVVTSVEPAKVAPADIKATVTAQWGRYDALPDSQKTAEALGGVFRSIKTELLRAPDQAAVADAVHENESQFRSRAARRVRPESYAKGYRNVTLVPSNDPAQCMTWGGMWAGDAQMVANMRGMGFQFIECRDKTWTL